jgi:uncharacterized repeat protein (TIGR03803 family)
MKVRPRSFGPSAEFLEDRATPSVSLTGLISLPSVNNLVYFPVPKGTAVSFGPPVSDAHGDIYYARYTANGSTSQTAVNVFELPAGSKTPKSLGSFSEPTPLIMDAPNPLVVDSAGDVFGTTADAGPQQSSSIFEIRKGSGTAKTMVTSPDGNQFGPLTMVGSVIYGTWNGGVFSLNAGSTKFAWTAKFNTHTGSGLCPALTLAGNTLYGATSTGGNSGAGGVFSIPVGSQKFTTLNTFNEHTLQVITGPLVVTGGFVYGITVETGDHGTVFKEPVGGGAPKTAASFHVSNGELPQGLINDGGALIGVASAGGAGHGLVYSVNSTTLAVNVVATFGGGSLVGGNPPQGLSLDSSGNVYGESYTGSGSTAKTLFWKLSGLRP